MRMITGQWSCLIFLTCLACHYAELGSKCVVYVLKSRKKLLLDHKILNHCEYSQLCMFIFNFLTNLTCCPLLWSPFWRQQNSWGGRGCTAGSTAASARYTSNQGKLVKRKSNELCNKTELCRWFKKSSFQFPFLGYFRGYEIVHKLGKCRPLLEPYKCNVL